MLALRDTKGLQIADRVQAEEILIEDVLACMAAEALRKTSSLQICLEDCPPTHSGSNGFISCVPSPRLEISAVFLTMGRGHTFLSPDE